MDKDTQTSSNPEVQREQEHQNRRQFFNSLGKWSLAVVAAVAALHEDFHLRDVESGIGSPPETRFGGLKDPRQQIAVKPTPHRKGHEKTWENTTRWVDNTNLQGPGGTKSPGGSIRAPGGSQEKTD